MSLGFNGSKPSTSAIRSLVGEWVRDCEVKDPAAFGFEDEILPVVGFITKVISGRLGADYISVSIVVINQAKGAVG